MKSVDCRQATWQPAWLENVLQWAPLSKLRKWQVHFFFGTTRHQAGCKKLGFWASANTIARKESASKKNNQLDSASFVRAKLCANTKAAGRNTATEKNWMWLNNLNRLHNYFFYFRKAERHNRSVALLWCLFCVGLFFPWKIRRAHTPNQSPTWGQTVSFWVTNQIPDVAICSEHVSGVATGRRVFHHDIVWRLPTGFVRLWPILPWNADKLFMWRKSKETCAVSRRSQSCGYARIQ